MVFFVGASDLSPSSSSQYLPGRCLLSLLVHLPLPLLLAVLLRNSSSCLLRLCSHLTLSNHYLPYNMYIFTHCNIYTRIYIIYVYIHIIYIYSCSCYWHCEYFGGTLGFGLESVTYASPSESDSSFSSSSSSSFISYQVNHADGAKRTIKYSLIQCNATI